MPFGATIQWLNKTDGRDRLCKTIQYLALIFKNYFSYRKNADLANRLLTLFKQMRITRQFFRLFKSVEEYKNVKVFLRKSYTDEFDRMISILQYSLYGLYWFFDNFVVLCSCKLITWQTKPIYKVALYCKYLAILSNFLISSRNMLRLHHAEIKLRISLQEAHNNESENKDAVHKITEIKEIKTNLWVHLAKLVLDLFPAIEWSDVLYTWTKIRIWEGGVAITGLGSALLTTYHPRLDRDYWENTLKKLNQIKSH